MHILALAEGSVDYLKQFENYFNCKFYKQGKCKVRIREVKLYNIGFNECGYDDVLRDLKVFVRGKNNVNNGKSADFVDKVVKKISWLRKLFPHIKPIDEDLDKIKIDTNEEWDKLHKQGVYPQIALYPIGRIDDNRYNTGEEMV